METMAQPVDARTNGSLHEAIRGDAYDPGCPTRVVLDRVGDKWTVLVIGALADGPQRFTTLRQSVGGVTAKVLTQTLRAIERDGLVTRTVHAEVPPRVEYALTPLGHSLLEPVDALRRWAEEHLPEILAARATHETAALVTA